MTSELEKKFFPKVSLITKENFSDDFLFSELLENNKFKELIFDYFEYLDPTFINNLFEDLYEGYEICDSGMDYLVEFASGTDSWRNLLSDFSFYEIVKSIYDKHDIPVEIIDIKNKLINFEGGPLQDFFLNLLKANDYKWYLRKTKQSLVKELDSRGIDPDKWYSNPSTRKKIEDKIRYISRGEYSFYDQKKFFEIKGFKGDRYVMAYHRFYDDRENTTHITRESNKVIIVNSSRKLLEYEVISEMKRFRGEHYFCVVKCKKGKLYIFSLDVGLISEQIEGEFLRIEEKFDIEGSHSAYDIVIREYEGFEKLIRIFPENVKEPKRIRLQNEQSYGNNDIK